MKYLQIITFELTNLTYFQFELQFHLWSKYEGSFTPMG